MDKKKEFNETQQNMYDAIAVTIKTARWAYELALQEGFSKDEALKISIAYMGNLLNVASGATK